LGLRRPYWDKRVNYLDCFCCLTILLLILSSLYFNNGSFLDENVLPLSKVFCSISHVCPHGLARTEQRAAAVSELCME
jgi:hypothetical protein